MRDFSCCGVTLPTLHDLLQHYEEAHATKSPNQGHRGSQGENRAALAAAAIAQQQSQQHGSQGRGLQPDRTLDMQRKLGQNPLVQHADLDTIDDMELDDEPMGDGDAAPSQLFSPQLREGGQGGFGNSSQGPQLNLGMLPNHQGFNTPSQPGTPIGTSRPLSLQNNPTVSSVNTPTLMANPLQTSQFRATPDSSAQGTPAEIDESVVGGFGDLTMQNNLGQNQGQFGRFTGNADMVDLCIDEPAKRLFSPNGGMGTPNAHFKLSGAQYGPNSDIARRIREQQLLAGVPDTTTILPNEEPKPFRCPVIGCEKAYKNQNGLKYHKAVSLSPPFPLIIFLRSFWSNLYLSHSTATTTSNYTIMQMALSRLSIPKHQHHIPVPSAWRKRSHTAAKCAASDTRISTASNTTSRTLRPAIPISSLEVAI